MAGSARAIQIVFLMSNICHYRALLTSTLLLAPSSRPRRATRGPRREPRSNSSWQRLRRRVSETLHQLPRYHQLGLVVHLHYDRITSAVIANTHRQRLRGQALLVPPVRSVDLFVRYLDRGFVRLRRMMSYVKCLPKRDERFEMVADEPLGYANIGAR